MERKIAVCMAVYNGERFLSQQLSSILSQLRSFDQLVVSDDGSTDKSLEIVNGFQDQRILVVKNQGTHGFSYNFENALKNAAQDADIFMFSDQDDVWLPGRIQSTLECLSRSNFCCCDASLTDADLHITVPSRFAYYHIKTGFLANLVRTRYIGCCLAFDRQVYNKLFPFPTRRNLLPYDIWATLVGEGMFKTSLIFSPQMLHRRHGDNASNGGVQSSFSVFKRIGMRGYYLFCVVLRKMRRG